MNNLDEGMTKEQIIAAIAEATGTTPSSIDDAFITKIKEGNRNNNLKFWIGTSAEYNALGTYENNCFYIFTDVNEYDDIIEAAEDAAEAKANEVCASFRDEWQGDLSEVQEDVTEAQNDITAIEDTLALKGATLCEDSATPPALLDKTVTNIDKYSLVGVDVSGQGLILCTVEKREISGTEVYHILGTGTGRLTSSSSIWRVFVKITVNATTKKITDILCYTSAQTGTTVANPSTAYAAKIIGIV